MAAFQEYGWLGTKHIYQRPFSPPASDPRCQREVLAPLIVRRSGCGAAFGLLFSNSRPRTPPIDWCQSSTLRTLPPPFRAAEMTALGATPIGVMVTAGPVTGSQYFSDLVQGIILTQKLPRCVKVQHTQDKGIPPLYLSTLAAPLAAQFPHVFHTLWQVISHLSIVSALTISG